VLAVILMLFVFADIFVKKGITEVSTINSFITAMYPISVPIGMITLLRTRYRFMKRRGSWWQAYPLTFLSFAAFLILGLALPNREYNLLYRDWINLIMVNGMAALYLIMAVGILSGLYRVLIYKRSKMWVQITLTIGYMAQMLLLAGILDMGGKWLGDVGRFINLYVSLPTDEILYQTEYIASLYFFVTILLLRERLRP